MKIIQHPYDVQYTDKLPGISCRFEWYLGPGLREYFGTAGYETTSNGPDGSTTSALSFTALFRLNAGSLNKSERETIRTSITDTLQATGGYLALWSTAPEEELFNTDITGVAYINQNFFNSLIKNSANFENSTQPVLELLPMAYSPNTSIDENVKWTNNSILNLAQTSLEFLQPALTKFAPDDGAVVMGIIDDGVAIANERFRRSKTESRIAFAWRQDGPSSNMIIGRNYSESEINTNLSTSVSAGSIDEDEFYKKLDYFQYSALTSHQPAANRFAHGTHVLDLMAGEEMSKFEQPNTPLPPRPIVAVQLPAKTVADTSGSLLTDRAILGVEYILWCAEALKKNDSDPDLPVVINFSFGNIAGPHDGSSLIERYFDQKIQSRNNLQIVLPAGNSKLSRTHAKFKLIKKQSQTLRWRLQPDDQTLSWVHIYLPRVSSTQPLTKSIQIEIIPPGQNNPAPLQLTEDETRGILFKNEKDESIGLATYRFNHPVGEYTTGRGEFCIVIRATESREDTYPKAPSGIWQIKITRKHGSIEDDLPEEAVVHAWIERDDTSFGYPLAGRQSYFDDPIYEETKTKNNGLEDPGSTASQSPIIQDGLINAIATGYSPIVVGSMIQQNASYPEVDRPAAYSSGGPTQTKTITTHPARTGPDASAVSDVSLVHTGIIAAGTRSGSTVAINGTSVAAPQVARIIADNNAFTRTQISLITSVIPNADVKVVGAGKAPSTPLRKMSGKRVIPKGVPT